jgi:predicted nucleic acid-binding protein
MRVYLDCCSLQRPFDDRTQLRIAVEAEAVLSILALCESNKLTLVSSVALLYEINRIPDQERRINAHKILTLMTEMLELTPSVEAFARRLEASGFKPLDALHLAFASIAKVDYFCTCDDKFLRKAKGLKELSVKPVSPTEMVMELGI